MNSSKSDYFSASVVVYGAVCSLLLLCRICYRGVHPLIPGIGALTGLWYPILSFWTGVLLRVWHPHPRWWIQALVAAVSAFMLVCYIDVQYHATSFWSQFHLGMPLSMLGAGYLFLPGIESQQSRSQGLLSFIMLALSAFCYTALSVVKERMMVGRLVPEYHDIELLIRHLLLIAEPLLALVTICLAGQVTFSKISLKLGSVRWLRWLILFLSILVFFNEFKWFTFNVHYFGLGILIYVTMAFRLAVQPLCIYLIYTVGWRVGKRKMGKK